MKVRWLSSAAADLESISEYLHANAPAVAERILRRLFDGVNSLEAMPYKGSLHGKRGMRRLTFPKDPYIATYSIVGDAVHVLRIRHTSRRPLAS
jgi:toxin ParE1/3/4